MATIRLQHRAPSLRTYAIPVEHGGGEVHDLGRVTRAHDGSVGVRVISARLPTTITLTAKGSDGDTSEPLDEAVLRAPEIEAAVRAMQIAVIRTIEPDSLVPAPELPAEPVAEPAAPTTSKKPARASEEK